MYRGNLVSHTQARFVVSTFEVIIMMVMTVMWLCALQIYYIQFQPQASEPQLPEPFSGGAAEPDQPCLQEELHCPAKEKVKNNKHCL